MRSLADVYQEFVVELDPILWRAGRVNGVHVDDPARLTLLDTLNGEVDKLKTESQEYAPLELHPRKRYKNKPETDLPVEEVCVQSDSVKTCAKCGLQHVTKGEHTGTKGGRNGVPLNECYKAAIVLAPGVNTEYDEVLEFNPGSDDQLKAYAEHFHHKLGRNWKTGEDTLDAKQVQKFIDKYGDVHPIYEKALRIRKVKKARGYAKAWIPDEKGLLYGEFKHTPETLRLSQAEHNFTNVSHRGDAPYAHELRRLLVAPPGYLLVEADSSSVEAVFTGKFMGSDSYMEIARKGIHAWWSLKKLGLEFTKDNVKKVKDPDQFEEFWHSMGKTAVEIQIMYETKKRTVHGVSYGMGSKLLHESYPELFPVTLVPNPRTGRLERCALCSAQAEIDEFYLLVPDLKAWHLDTQKIAYKQGYLQSPWGIRNYYYQVFNYDFKTKKHVPGPDAKAVIAFQPQHANAMFQRENIKRIDAAIKKLGKQHEWLMPAIGHVHDSNGLRVPEDDYEKAGVMMAEVMNRPIKEFGGLQIGVAVKFGRDWDSMKQFYAV